jgi:hypothetical protein
MNPNSLSHLFAFSTLVLLFGFSEMAAGYCVLTPSMPIQIEGGAATQSGEASVFLTPNPEQPQLLEFSAQSVTSASVVLVGPFPSLLKVWCKNDENRKPLEWTFNTDASTATVHLTKVTKSRALPLSFLAAKHTGTLADGTFLFSAADATVVGKQAKLESHPGNYRIGYWGNANDFVSWKRNVPKGRYSVELVYSRASPDGTKVTLALGDNAFPMALKSTSSWYRYRSVSMGSWKHPGGEIEATMKVDKIINGGVMNLKAVILTPVVRSMGR